MSAIVCAIRGGPESEATLHRAVSLAKEKQLPLHLLYVVNLDFLVSVTGGHAQTVGEEVTSMGEFILEAAREEAEAQGLEVVTHVRRGKVSEQVIALVEELGADFVVVGKRRPKPDLPAAAQSVVLRFADRIREETGATVVVEEEEA